MNRFTALSIVRTRLQILLWRRGWAWPVALLLLAAAGAMQLMLLHPLRARLAVTQAELAHERSAASTKRVTVEPLSEGQELAVLQAVLRASPEPAELVRKMSALAQAEQITLQQGDYQQQLHTTTRLMQVHVTQPVRASYPQLRRYVESVLRTVPNASLDQVAARRENVGQAQLEARLRWSFWIQKDQAGQADDAGRNVK
ncbi:hypothetical protein [Ramlibacter sp. WS9]|uniref:hypothetical protein n=1 Tax=Ramlibacter sp. WS9 TaxID=1882741 RepID=UPI001143F497|nr:hypothetical protein [Ramlibacter sp. WS9]ROZ79742.1 hypothetical protein EEB15_02230 [Ramlibacter sp. WS9]